MQKNLLPTSVVLDPNTPRSFLLSPPAHLQRKIAARWQEWVPWARIHLLHRNYDAAGMSTEFARLRRRHSEHLVALMRAGIAMRQVRRHQLDDPRITDEAHGMLVRAAMEQRRKAWLARHRGLRDPDSTMLSELDNFAY